jgi:hypothetical protein
MIGAPLKNVIRYSLSGLPYDIWAFPGLIFILSSIVLLPPLYREFFDLRIHGKVLINIALTPHSKIKIIFSSLISAIIEALIVAIITGVLYTSFIPITFTLSNVLFFIVCLILYLFLIGNLFIMVSLIIDTLTTAIITIAMIFLLIIFGNGFIIETSFFPIAIETFIKSQPLSIPFRLYQTFNQLGIMNYTLLFILLPINYLWIILNGYLLKKKLLQ